ncbi:hypothetical protein C3R74_08505 [Acidithiobacillus ferridurans]|uniref:DUF3987 domain-containing protein n=1 Tax=Acidithiobacillus ferridurans TaxID=1232575 RepID=UPI000DE4F777|nr:DUF3987 domain-containing protein [Acidithiobacillus ferridurans]RBM00262.1 hypothetical protein C3R74_08505 [Acidithiobacillus ferridurans]
MYCDNKLEDAFPMIPYQLNEIGDIEMPYRYLPDNICALAYEAQTINRSPVMINVAVILSTLSAIHGSKVDVDGIYGVRIPLNLYILVISGTGEGKSSAVSTLMAGVSESDEEIKKRKTDKLNVYRADSAIWKSHYYKLIDALKKTQNETTQNIIHGFLVEHEKLKPSEPNLTGVLLTDASITGLRNALQNKDSATLLVNPDAGVFIKDMLLKHANEFCKAWSGEGMHIEKYRNSLHVEDPRISMLLMAQPAVTEGILDQDHSFRTSGLAARFLIMQPESMVGRKHLIMGANERTKEHLADWNRMVRKELQKNSLAHNGDLSSERRMIRICPQGKQFLASSATQLDQILGMNNLPYSGIKDLSCRVIEQTCRLAALFELHLEPNADEVSFFNVEKAFYFMKSYITLTAKLASPDRPRVSTVEKANMILYFLSRSRNLMPFYFPNSPYPTNGMFMDTFQKSSPVRGKKKYEEALQFLVNNRRINIIDYHVSNFNHRVKKVILLLDASPAFIEEFNGNCMNHLLTI